jgi:methionyl-tRNA formyltransferase
VRVALAGILGRGDPLSSLARESRIPERSVDSDDGATASTLAAFQPDILCILTLPWLVGPATLAVPRLTLNVHPSLLPRHRGPNPYFWQYYHGDELGGLSIHTATGQADAGPIWTQSSVPVDRGYPVQSLHDDLAARAAEDLPVALAKLGSGAQTAVVQDEGRASAAPRVARLSRVIDFAKWDAARIWHFLRGMSPKYREYLVDESGRRVRYRTVGDWHAGDPRHDPGRATRTPDGWTLWCRNGWIELRRKRGV